MHTYCKTLVTKRSSYRWLTWHLVWLPNNMTIIKRTYVTWVELVYRLRYDKNLRTETFLHIWAQTVPLLKSRWLVLIVAALLIGNSISVASTIFTYKSSAYDDVHDTKQIFTKNLTVTTNVSRFFVRLFPTKKNKKTIQKNVRHQEYVFRLRCYGNCINIFSEHRVLSRAAK